ncbi:MAG: hypothetical protein ABR585_06445 [Gemmatimonadaceae bacterium]
MGPRTSGTGGSFGFAGGTGAGTNGTGSGAVGEGGRHDAPIIATQQTEALIAKRFIIERWVAR